MHEKSYKYCQLAGLLTLLCAQNIFRVHFLRQSALGVRFLRNEVRCALCGHFAQNFKNFHKMYFQNYSKIKTLILLHLVIFEFPHLTYHN